MEDCGDIVAWGGIAVIISVDARMIQSSGIGRYLQQVLPQVVRYLPEYQFCLLGSVATLSQYEWVKSANVRVIECEAPIYSLAEQWRLIRKIPANTDLFWSPHYNIPILYQGRLLVTIHDVLHLAMPELFPGWHKQLYAKGMFQCVAHKADTILVVSAFTQHELLRFISYDIGKMQVIPNGIDPTWLALKGGNPVHSRPYFLYVGNVKPHKNIGSLLRAFDLLKNEIPHDIVIVGRKEGFITGDTDVINEADKIGERIIFTGMIDDGLLQQYFLGAEALIFPSLYEGFGLPPLEAMACGCPVIVSRAASMPEVCGDAALYCDPRQPEDIAKQMCMLLQEQGLRERLRIKGFEQARLFSWEKCGKSVAAVMRKVLSQ